MDPRPNRHQLRRGEIRFVPFPPASLRLSGESCTPLLCPSSPTRTRSAGLRVGFGGTLVFAPLCYPAKPENKLNYKLFKLPCQEKNGDPYRIRTDVNGVRGRCLNHLTNGPYRLTLQCGNLSFPQIRCAPWAHLTQGWCTFTDSNRGPTD